MSCMNCKAPVNDQVDGHCLRCRREAAKAPKITDDINNMMEATGVKLRFHEDLVRAHLLQLAREGQKSTS
jgi:hypothetical protein